MVRKLGRFPKLPQELQELILNAEEAKKKDKEDALNELKKSLKKEASMWGSVQGSGKVCLKRPVSSNGRCAWHGGKANGQKTKEGEVKAMSNLNPKAALVHGIYSKDFKENLTKEEVDFYNSTIDFFLEEAEKLAPINLAMLDRYILNFIKQARKNSADFLSDSPS